MTNWDNAEQHNTQWHHNFVHNVMLIESYSIVIALLWQDTTDSDKKFTLKK